MKKFWAITAILVAILGLGAWFLSKRDIKKDWEPLARQRLIQYLEERFNSSVEIGELDFKLLSPTRIEAIGKRFQIRHQRRTDIPPILAFEQVNIQADLTILYSDQRVVDLVVLKGLKVNLPPRNERPKSDPSTASSEGSKNAVLVRSIIADGTQLQIMPSKAGKAPLDFDLGRLRLTGIAAGQPFEYDAVLDIPKPPGRVTSKGHFGPWNSADPRQTSLDGTYDYREANLGVFKGIDGTLASTGKFSGVLENIAAEGECRVPNFRLSMSGNPVPLNVNYNAVVDGADGDTYLKNVQALLGKTPFTATGEVVGQKGVPGRAIHLDVLMPNGDLDDILKLTLKGNNRFLAGKINLKTTIDIPRGNIQIIEKIRLKGRFEIREANFTSNSIQDKIDGLSKRGQGRPKDQQIDNVPATFNGQFTMSDGTLDFAPVIFVVPGALVDLNGDYNLKAGQLDFHGSLNLDSKVSDTFSGWKRWALKPFNPIFSKNEAGTYLPIKITGDKDNPQFGLDRGKKKD